MTKSFLLNSASSAILGRMTPAEMAKGRYMRAPDEHPATPAPTPAPAPAAEPEGQGTLELTTEQQLEQEFPEVSGDVEPATPATDADASTRAEGDPTPEGEQGQQEGRSVQERIDEITAARREAERQAAEARREADEWRRKAEATATPPKSDGKSDRDPNAEPKAEDYEFGEADPRFIAETSRYHARQEFQSQQQQAEVRGQIAEMEAGWSTRIADPELVKQYPDFDEKVTKGAAEGKWDCPPLIALGIKSSDHGPDIAYHLATNTAEAARIAQLSPIEQAREFGRLEGERIAAKRAAGQPQPKTVTNAPPPPDARSRGAGGRFAADADTDDFAAFEKLADGVLKG